MRVLLDACVLFPTVLRQVLVASAGAGLIEPFWSERILEEWRRAVLRVHPEDGGVVAGEIAALRVQFPDAAVTPDAEVETRLSLPDLNDRHVLAAALAAAAEAIVTLNLRDFPGRTLAREGIVVRHPDSLLVELHQNNPHLVTALVAPIVEAASDATGLTSRKILKKAGLPRLGKALG
jgi:predicted nucleic acid-binding protein